MKRAFVLTCMMALIVAFAFAVAAQEEEHQPDPPYEGPCIGSNDPYCGGGGGSGGGGTSVGCKRCYINLSTGEYQCLTVTLRIGEPPAYGQCTAYANGCSTSELCYVA